MMGIQVTYYGHSCFVLESGGYQIAIDPYYDGSVPGYGPLALTANEVLCSHEHKDHSNTEAVKLISGPASPFTVQSIVVPHDDAGGTLRGMTKIHIFTSQGIRIAHFGDIGCHPDEGAMAELAHLDAAMLPVGGAYTITAVQARALADELEIPVVIPMHYRSGCRGFDVLQTLDEFLAVSTPVIRCPANTFNLTAGMSPKTVVLNYEGGLAPA